MPRAIYSKATICFFASLWISAPVQSDSDAWVITKIVEGSPTVGEGYQHIVEVRGVGAQGKAVDGMRSPAGELTELSSKQLPDNACDSFWSMVEEQNAWSMDDLARTSDDPRKLTLRFKRGNKRKTLTMSGMLPSDPHLKLVLAARTCATQ